MSKRNGMLTRTGWTYDILLTYQDGRQERVERVLRKRDDEKALKMETRFSDVKCGEIRALYRDLYSMSPAHFFRTADIIQRESVYID